MNCNFRNSLYEERGECRICRVRVVHSACSVLEQGTLPLKMSCLSKTITSLTTAIKACTEMCTTASCFQKKQRSAGCICRKARWPRDWRINKPPNWLTPWSWVFLGSHQSLGYSRISNHFIEPESSLPSSQELTTSPYPEPDESSLLSNIQFCLFPSDFPTKILYVLFSLRPAHLILFDSIILIISGDVYTLWSPSLCNFLHPPTISSLFGPNILLRILFSNSLVYVLPLMSKTKFHNRPKQEKNLWFCIF
jgi:hypothetical protein